MAKKPNTLPRTRGRIARRGPGRPPASEGRPTPREAILDAAHELFYRDSASSVGVDAIAKSAGVSKASLYQVFTDKRGLVEAYVRHRDAVFRAWFAERMQRAPDNPRERLLHVFDVARAFTLTPGYCGCAFINAAADARHAARTSHDTIPNPVLLAALAHKRSMRKMLAELCRAAGARTPEVIAAQLVALLDGLSVATMMNTDAREQGELFDALRLAAGVLIDVDRNV